MPLHCFVYELDADRRILVGRMGPVELLEAVKPEHDKDFTIVQFPDGNHPLMQSRLGGRAERLVLSQFVPGMFTTIEAWLEERGFMP